MEREDGPESLDTQQSFQRWEQADSVSQYICLPAVQLALGFITWSLFIVILSMCMCGGGRGVLQCKDMGAGSSFL